MQTVSRASLYYQPAAPSAQELALKRRIDELFTAHPFYDSRCILGRVVDWGMDTANVPDSVFHPLVAKLQGQCCVRSTVSSSE